MDSDEIALITVRCLLLSPRYRENLRIQRQCTVDFSKTASESPWHSDCDRSSLSAGCSKRPFSKAATSEDARRALRHVELLSEARTKLADFFSILLGGRAVDHRSLGFMCEDSLARTHAGETNGNVILEQAQPDPPLVVASWLPERPRHGSPGSARPGAAAPSLHEVLWGMNEVG